MSKEQLAQIEGWCVEAMGYRSRTISLNGSTRRLPTVR